MKYPWLYLAVAAFLTACPQNPPPPTLGRPGDFTATVGSSTSIGLRWLKVEGAAAYQLERKVGSGSFSPLVSIPHEMGGPLVQSHTDSGLTPGTRYTYRIRAVNAGLQSEWSTSAEVETPAAASTRYRVSGYWLGASDPNLYLVTDTGVVFSSATVTVNGTPLTYRNPPGSYYAPSLPGATAGTVLNLNITVPEGTITASAAIPQAPSLTAPAADARITENRPLTVTWNYTGPDPDRFYLHLLGDGPLNYVAANISGAERSFTIPADQVVVPAGGRASLFLYAVNDGKASFSGPVLPTSAMGVAASTSVIFDIVPAPPGLPAGAGPRRAPALP
ncbi:fibronectin type III domain-containing protein [Meiothermus sp. QL-1]|uniref:fibronectin type III domain-containing protein n=1 Tax=Meiothermus sp. QL-1 TaxID=2058095 RepID=UPI001314C8A6|nr:fibronectin type III domain-containing protein [Meiothermus sp. QL-1]